MMNTDIKQHIPALEAILGKPNVTTDKAALISGSKDSYHFSPVLLEELEGCTADLIVRPETQEQLKALIAFAVQHDIPITPRGAGTGNYGQGVPMQGGILVNTKKINRVLELTHEYARVECGTVLWQIEKQAAELNAELRIFPSTMPTSSSAGFVTGGSGGVGSITWGMLSDNENVRYVKALTCEEEPQVLELRTQEEIRDVMHNCGLTAFVTEVEFALAPKKAWHQYVFSFDDFYTALKAGEQLALDESLTKRLLSVFEWPIPSYFLPLVKKGACEEGNAQLFLMTDKKPDELTPYLAELTKSGLTSFKQVFHAEPSKGPSRGFQIYDFTWNHTTMWAMKCDKELTYLQDAFDPEIYIEQIKKRKEKYGEHVFTHVEFLKSGGETRPGGLSVVRYKDAEHLKTLINDCEELGIRVSNPHTHFLDADIRWYGKNIRSARAKWDPNGLLNPGHLLDLDA